MNEASDLTEAKQRAREVILSRKRGRRTATTVAIAAAAVAGLVAVAVISATIWNRSYIGGASNG